MKGRSKLKDLKESGGEAWNEIKEGADSIWDTMKATFKEVKEKFKDDDEVKSKGYRTRRKKSASCGTSSTRKLKLYGKLYPAYMYI